MYSAGHAQLDYPKPMLMTIWYKGRDRQNTFILGDSGGFQIIKGVIHNVTGLTLKVMTAPALTIPNWLEHTADYSMISRYSHYGGK